MQSAGIKARCNYTRKKTLKICVCVGVCVGVGVDMCVGVCMCGEVRGQLRALEVIVLRQLPLPHQPLKDSFNID